ncbi:VOC family protein [Rhodococcus opacus]|uniref:VOC family protein n=1 Tax=Rhodococcus opacus TaxID=37919 RepID=UPI002475857F|nr:VOC family protein [Rhodococcus opacus]MDH6292125.1 putative lactoylglutathione lyase [Rhodococcus opacus]
MSTMIFVNLPVKDLGKSTAFYEALGYRKNPQFSDENASSIVVSEQIHVMLLTEKFFSTFTKKAVADATTTTESIICISADSREAVDALADKALASGGSFSNDPMDEGFMYGRSFQDPDGHLWEIMWMDVDAAQGQES